MVQSYHEWRGPLEDLWQSETSTEHHSVRETHQNEDSLFTLEKLYTYIYHVTGGSTLSVG